MKEAFLQSIREEFPNEEVSRLVFADWCAENEPELEEKLRKHIPPPDWLKVHRKYTSGFGKVSGSGDGYGSGFRIGLGYGSGYGFNNYIGHGDGFRNRSSSELEQFEYFISSKYELRMPKLNSNQLILMPFGNIFCGYVAEQIEPYVFKITNASILYDSGFYSWKSVAKGNRRGMLHKKYGTIRIGPQIFHSMDWVGNLP